MFDAFAQSFIAGGAAVDPARQLSAYPTELQEFLARFGGLTFNCGLYRVFGDRARADIFESACLAFPELGGRFIPVGAEWQGRVVALKSEGPATALLLDVAGHRVSDSGLSLREVHDELFPVTANNMLAQSFFDDWMQAGGSAPSYGQCAGYKIPLFLNGVDDVENMAVSDLSGYWRLFASRLAQLIRRH